mmetsp:Transcript_10273/g.24129  ORF Transcript_10273/g.24129 Transcript_10273/m.24129 type:complete len:213 (+) Transcript_10273:206-844(+)
MGLASPHALWKQLTDTTGSLDSRSPVARPVVIGTSMLALAGVVTSTWTADSEDCLRHRRSGRAHQGRSEPSCMQPRHTPERCACLVSRHRCFSVAREHDDISHGCRREALQHRERRSGGRREVAFRFGDAPAFFPRRSTRGAARKARHRSERQLLFLRARALRNSPGLQKAPWRPRETPVFRIVRRACGMRTFACSVSVCRGLRGPSRHCRS